MITDTQFSMSNPSKDSGTLMSDILTRALICRSKTKVNLEEFLKIITDFQIAKKNSDGFRKKRQRSSASENSLLHKANSMVFTVNDKGIFINVMAELLFKAYLLFQIQIKSLSVQFQIKEKKKPRKTINDGDRQRVRKRRKVEKNRRRNEALRDVGNNIQDLSNDSLSNPSNIERPRTQIEKKQGSSNNDNSNKDKAEDNSQGSKGSKQSKGLGQQEKDQMKFQLNKITQQIRVNDETYMTGMEEYQNLIQIQQNSQSNSNSMSNSQQIKNYEEKWQILSTTKNTYQQTRKKTGNKRNSNRNANNTRTKKKNLKVSEEILDQSLEETRYETDVTMMANMSNLNTTDMRVSIFDENQDNPDSIPAQELRLQYQAFQEQYLEDLFFSTINQNKFGQKRKNHHQDQGKKFFPFQNFKEVQKIQKVREFLMNFNDGHDPSDNYRATGEDEGFIDMGYPDYTMSQPLTAPAYLPQNQSYDNDIKQELQLSRNQDIDLRKFSKNTGKNICSVFYELLLRNQREQIELIQKQPEHFSEIYIHHL